MKEQFKLEAVNLKSYSISEADKIIVMYSKEKGIVKGIARGIKKPSNKLGAGRMELLSANSMVLSRGRNFDTICQAEAVNTFFDLRKDINKMFYAMYCAEIAANFGREHDPDSEAVYNLLYGLLDTVSRAEKKEQAMLAVLRFQLKIMDITGYTLELKECVKCRKTPEKNEVYFSAAEGGILCGACAAAAPAKVRIPAKIREFLYALMHSEFSEHTLYDDKADEKVCSVCINLLRNYIEYYSPKKFKTSAVLQSLS